MVRFNEIPKKVGEGLEAVKKFTQEQLREREARLSNPALKIELERTKELLIEDIKSLGKNGVDAVYRFILAAPVSALWEGTKEFGSVVSRNMSVKNPKNKRSYTDVPAAAMTEFLMQWGKGTISTAKLVGNLAVALGRGTVLLGRHTIGK